MSVLVSPEAPPVMEDPTTDIRGYRNIHAGEDIYVIAAGGSMNYLDPRFFDGKIVVAVNEIAVRWGIPQGWQPRVTYGVAKEQTTVEEVAAGTLNGEPIINTRTGQQQAPGGYRLFASLHENGHLANPARQPYPEWPNVAFFRHDMNHAEAFDVYAHWPADPDALVVSMSTITSGMHLAAYMGASNILVSGHDCGQVGPTDYVDGYTAPTAAWKESWLQAIEKQSIAIKRELMRRYGCRIYGLSPFVTPNLEGVPYRGANRINDW